MQSVALSPSGIYTASTKRPPLRSPVRGRTSLLLGSCETISPLPSWEGLGVGLLLTSKRYFTVPSELLTDSTGGVMPGTKRAESLSRAAFERFVISSIEATRRAYSHSIICLAAYDGSPSSRQISCSSASDKPIRLSLLSFSSSHIGAHASILACKISRKRPNDKIYSVFLKERVH